MYTSVLKVLTASRNCVPLLPILAIGSENTHFDISWSSYKKSFVNTGPAPFWRLLLFNSPSVYIQTISRASLYIHQRAILCSKNLCFEISSSTVTGTKNYKTVSRRKNSVKKPFTNASRGAFRVQRTLVTVHSNIDHQYDSVPTNVQILANVWSKFDLNRNRSYFSS